MPARLRALRDDRVDAGALEDAASSAVVAVPATAMSALLQRLRVDEPEREAENRRPLLEHDGERVLARDTAARTG